MSIFSSLCKVNKVSINVLTLAILEGGMPKVLASLEVVTIIKSSSLSSNTLIRKVSNT